MRRREFLVLLGTTGMASLAARAQQPAIPVVGYLSATTSDIVRDVQKGLSETGFVEGRNLSVEARFANNNYSQLPQLAADLVRRRVSVIYASGGAVAVRAAKAATSTVPIVFAMGADPVAMGFVASLNRPGGNITGISFLSNELGAKRLGLLNELVPRASRYAALVNLQAPGTDSLVAEFRAAASVIGKQIEVFSASDADEIDSAFAQLVSKGAEALVVGSSSLFNSRGVQLATLGAYHRLPAIYYDRRLVELGGLMSYGASITEASRQAGVYVGRIPKGEKPSDLPVMQMTQFDLVINLRTTKTLGLTVPPTLRALATEVIE
jgi:putative ABC transport system substrate-binding protein